jgi:asparagine synthase (glutamine-hydrolysing)
MRYSLEVRTPFLDKDFIEYAINIPIKYRLENSRMKPILRYAFPEIPKDILWREKVCEGEGVGIDPILKPKKEDIKTLYKKLFK